MDWNAITQHLAAKLDPKYVKKPPAGKYGEYIEGFHAINEANRIFGFGDWSYRIEYLSCVHKAQQGDKWQACYECSVTVTVGGVSRQDVGYGSGFSKSLGDALESAGKEAATDALKRTLRTFGNPFGLALYDKSKANVGVPDKIYGEAPTRTVERHDAVSGMGVADDRNPPPPPAPEAVRDDGATIREAFEDGIRDSLEPGHTQRDFYVACAEAMAVQFAAYKTIDGLNSGFAKYWRLLAEMEANEPDVHACLLTDKELARKSIENAPPKPMLTKPVGEKIMFAIRCCETVEALEKYTDELGESDQAFALDHPKIREALKARRAVLAEPIYMADRHIG
jgi:DNA recombination protein Rad52